MNALTNNTVIFYVAALDGSVVTSDDLVLNDSIAQTIQTSFNPKDNNQVDYQSEVGERLKIFFDEGGNSFCSLSEWKIVSVKEYPKNSLPPDVVIAWLERIPLSEEEKLIKTKIQRFSEHDVTGGNYYDCKYN